jgi:flavin-dependent dehydrogenase
MGRNCEGELYDQTTWQVRRAEFDKMLLDEAKNLGTEVIDARAMGVLRDDAGQVCGITIRKEDGTEQEIHADVVVDASGQNTFLSNAGVTSPKERGNYSKQVALYTHVKGAIRDEGKMRDDTLIFYQKRNHWAWFIPLNEEVVSVGIVTPAEYFKTTGEDRDVFFMR